MSGVTAAKRLKELGYTNFKILEGSDRVGGRAIHETLGDYTVELGPVVIHASDDNPILALAKAYNVSYGFIDYEDWVVRDKDGNNVTNEARAIYERFGPVLAALKLQINQSWTEDRPDFNLRSALLKAGWRPSSFLDDLIEYLEIDVLYGYSPEETSGKYSFLSEEKESRYYFRDIYIKDDRGYAYLINKLLEEVIGDDAEKLKFNQIVSNIEDTGDQVTVTTSTGESYTADYVILTLSLGVLQGKRVEFRPELPEWKMDAIQQFQIAQYTNIYVQYNTSFWDENEWILYADDSDGFNLIFNGNKIYPDSNILHFEASNKNARRIERLTDEEIILVIEQKLKNLYASSNVTIPKPVSYKISRFSENPFFLGAWSNWPPGYTKDSHDALKAPFNRIYFAGEHTSARYYGYLHGAYYSGIDVIDELDKCIQQSECQVFVPVYAARGCSYAAASNYDPAVKEEDGTCTFSCISASNYYTTSLITLSCCLAIVMYL